MAKIPQSFITDLFYNGFHEYPKLQDLYVRFWNPANYALIGSIGVAINYLVWLLLQSSFPWFITNFLAILTAWGWNWLNSVGPLAYLWGFRKRKES